MPCDRVWSADPPIRQVLLGRACAYWPSILRLAVAAQGVGS
jgi:hypothetical protein